MKHGLGLGWFGRDLHGKQQIFCSILREFCWCHINNVRSVETMKACNTIPTSAKNVYLSLYYRSCAVVQCFEYLQCFDAFGWAAGRASGL